MEKRIFVVGPTRSGTTLMREILNKHSKIGIVGETHLFNFFDYGKRDIVKIRNLVPIYRKKHKFTTIDSYIDFLQKNITEWEFYNKQKLKSVLEKNFNNKNPKEFLEDLFDFVYPNKIIKGEKTPVHVLHYNTIKNYYPNAYFIQMIRNPFAEINSLLAKYKAIDSNIIHKLRYIIPHCRRWNYIAKKGYYRNSENSKYKVVKFENLVNSPTQEIKSICKFININFEEEMLNISKINSSFESNYKAEKGFSDYVINKWKNELRPNEKKIINFLCDKKYRDKYHY